jgi:hypothetical protein
MRQRSRVWTCSITAVALIAALALFWQQRHQSEAIAGHTVVGKSAATTAPTVETNKIVPADVVGTGAVHWAPLTGDGSN